MLEFETHYFPEVIKPYKCEVINENSGKRACPDGKMWRLGVTK